MSNLSGTDFFIVDRCTVNYKVTAQDVGTFVANAVFPSQSGQSGKFLTTNGSTTSWASALSTITGNNGISAVTSSGAVTVGVQSGAAVAYPSSRYVLTGPVSLGGPGETGPQSQTYGSISVNYASGATQGVMWQRMRVDTVPAAPSGLTAGQNLRFEVSLSGGASFSGSTETAAYGFNAGSISANGRGWTQSQYLVRADLVTLPAGSTSFTVNATVGQDLGIQAYNNFSGWQITFQPLFPVS